jgi:hypothetical protein
MHLYQVGLYLEWRDPDLLRLVVFTVICGQRTVPANIRSPGLKPKHNGSSLQVSGLRIHPLALTGGNQPYRKEAHKAVQIRLTGN